MTQASLDLGRQLRDAGIEQTLGAQRIDWLPSYQIIAERFLEQLPRLRNFTAEDIRIFALSHGLSQPGHVNSWGAAARSILKRWQKERRISQVMPRQCQRAEARARLIRAYLKLA